LGDKALRRLKETPRLNNRTLLTLLLAIGFVGATSCGDDQSKKDAEIMALRQQLAAQQAANAAAGVGVNNVVVYSTQTNTAVVSSTTTSVTGTYSNHSTGTYTITGTVGSTSTSTGSTSTSTAGRE